MAQPASAQAPPLPPSNSSSGVELLTIESAPKSAADIQWKPSSPYAQRLGGPLVVARGKPRTSDFAIGNAPPPRSGKTAFASGASGSQLAYQTPFGRGAAGGTMPTEDTGILSPVQLEPPGLERLARLDSEDQLEERIRQETRERDPTERISFPPEPILSRDTYNGRGPIWSPRQVTVEPNVLFYGKLLFEQKNFERYGWDLGILNPIVSAGTFFADVALLPYNAATCPCQPYDSSAGQPLPGDPMPLLLYPPELSFTSAFAETAAILALVAIFP